MQGKGKFGWFTLVGVRNRDGCRVRLGRTTSQHTAEGIALSILRSSSMWRHIDIMEKGGVKIKQIDKPALQVR
jgi:hypothetical protein